MLTCIVAFSMESNFGPSILGTLDTISISNRPTVLFGGILPAWGERRRAGRGGGQGEEEGEKRRRGGREKEERSEVEGDKGRRKEKQKM